VAAVLVSGLDVKFHRFRGVECLEWYRNFPAHFPGLVLNETMLGGSPCHHGMARPRVANGRDGLQLEVSCEYIE
jgi:hypothetical protein